MTALANQEPLVLCEKCHAVMIAAYKLDEDGKRVVVLMCPACGREEKLD